MLTAVALLILKGFEVSPQSLYCPTLEVWRCGSPGQGEDRDTGTQPLPILGELKLQGESMYPPFPFPRRPHSTKHLEQQKERSPSLRSHSAFSGGKAQQSPGSQVGEAEN